MRRINDKSQLDGIVNANGAASDKPGAEAPHRESYIQSHSFQGYLEEGKKMEKPRELFSDVLVEHEVSMMFGDTGIGKSTLAIQIAEEVARKGFKTLYVNFELAQTQLAQRYQLKVFSENLRIATIDYALMHDVTEQGMMLEEIERLAVEDKVEVLVIDNFTNLCVNSKEGSEAGNIMLKLLSLRMQHKWTILILAHVPKRKPGDPLTLNDLAGSKIISNMADNVVGINKSKKDKNMRYLIQQKYRSFPIELDSKNVQELMMTTSDGWLHFERGGYSEEVSHLPRSRDEKAELEREILKELKESNGLTYRDIAEKLETSPTKVSNVAKKNGLGKKTAKQGKA